MRSFTIIVLLMLLMVVVGFTLAQQPAWRLAIGTEGLRIKDIDIYPSDPDTLYAISTYEFLISADRGENWQIIPNNIEGGASAALKVDPFDSRRIYASHHYASQGKNAVSISLDGGYNWQLLFWGTFIQAAVVEIDPSNHWIIYAGQGPDDIRKSTDHGLTWDLLPTDSTMRGGFWDLAIATTNPQVLYAAYYSGIFKSNDGGYQWEELPLGIQVTWPQVEVDSRDEDIVYVTSFTYGSDSGGVFKSVDGGVTWKAMNNGLTQNDWDIETIEINPQNPEEIYVGTGGGSAQTNLLFRTTNGGEDWINFSNGLSGVGHVKSIVIDAIYGRVYAGSARGIYIYDYINSANHAPSERPANFILDQNYPNPFNSNTIITFTLPRREFITIKVYDVWGRQINTLLQGYKASGTHNIEWNAKGIAGGVYFYKMTIESHNLVRKALLIK